MTPVRSLEYTLLFFCTWCQQPQPAVYVQYAVSLHWVNVDNAILYVERASRRRASLRSTYADSNQQAAGSMDRIIIIYYYNILQENNLFFAVSSCGYFPFHHRLTTIMPKNDTRLASLMGTWTVDSRIKSNFGLYEMDLNFIIYLMGKGIVRVNKLCVYVFFVSKLY